MEYTKVLIVLDFVLLELLDNANVNNYYNIGLDECTDIIYKKYCKSISANMRKEL
jgi:hypothetical protein